VCMDKGLNDLESLHFGTSVDQWFA
jgi:hypothetical protein